MDDWNVIKSRDLCERCYWGDCGGEPGRECKLCQMWGTGNPSVSLRLTAPFAQGSLGTAHSLDAFQEEGVGKGTLGNHQSASLTAPLEGGGNGRMVSVPAVMDGKCMCGDVRKGTPCPYFKERKEN